MDIFNEVFGKKEEKAITKVVNPSSKNLRLDLIEEGIIKVYLTDQNVKVVDARELHAGLGNKRKFADWAKQRFEEVEAVENTDFVKLHNFVKVGNLKRPQIEYIIKVDIAKEIAMLERNDKGKAYRRYFIDLENRYKEGKLTPVAPKSNNEVIGYYKPITVKPELYQRVKELAASKGMNLNEVVEYMLSTPTSIVPRPSNEVKINYQIATLEALQNQKDITVSEVCEIARTIATLVSVNSELSGR